MNIVNKYKMLTIILSLCVILGGCSNQVDDETETSEVVTTSTEGNQSTITFGSSITADSGVDISGDIATITESGTYTLTGSGDGQALVIDDENLEVNLIFDDLTLTNDIAALQVINAKSLTIELVGTSSIADGANNSEFQAPIYIDEVETTISGDGTLNLTGNCLEGLESNNDLIINSGTINVTAADDGLNVGDNLIINGGTINIDSNGDGLDSNGSLEINGGTIFVSGGNNGNGPIDYASEEGETFTLTGGTLIAVGGNMGVSTSSETQLSRSGTGNGTTIVVGDIEYTAPKQFSYYFVSTPDLTEDTTITVDGNATTDTTGQGEMMGGGGGRPQMGNENFGDGQMTPPGFEE